MAARNTTSTAHAVHLDRQIKAIELRRMGKGYVEIATALGIGKSQAHRLVKAGLEETKAQVTADAADLKSEALSRLDGMLAGIWQGARKGNVSDIDRVLKIEERRAKLLGLDAPTKVAETDPEGNAAGPREILLVSPGDKRPT